MFSKEWLRVNKDNGLLKHSVIVFVGLMLALVGLAFLSGTSRADENDGAVRVNSGLYKACGYSHTDKVGQQSYLTASGYQTLKAVVCIKHFKGKTYIAGVKLKGPKKYFGSSLINAVVATRDVTGKSITTSGPSFAPNGKWVGFDNLAGGCPGKCRVLLTGSVNLLSGGSTGVNISGKAY
jgi:hypothetical protein